MCIGTCNPRGTFSQYANVFNKREEAEKLYDLFAADGLPCTLCMAIESSNKTETDDLQPLEVMGRKREKGSIGLTTQPRVGFLTSPF